MSLETYVRDLVTLRWNRTSNDDPIAAHRGIVTPWPATRATSNNSASDVHEPQAYTRLQDNSNIINMGHWELGFAHVRLSVVNPFSWSGVSIDSFTVQSVSRRKVQYSEIFSKAQNCIRAFGYISACGSNPRHAPCATRIAPLWPVESWAAADVLNNIQFVQSVD